MMGALLKAELLPLKEEEFRQILGQNFRENRLAINLQALEEGKKMI
jgi:hypothetical protein